MGRGCQTSSTFVKANMEVRRTPVLVVLLLIVRLSASQDVLKFCVNETIFKLCENESSDFAALKMQCVKGQNDLDCMRLVRDGKADIVKLEPPEIYTAGYFFKLELAAINLIPSEQGRRPIDIIPVAAYRYNTVVVVRINSGIKTLEDLKDKKACLSSVGTDKGWNIPVGNLLNKVKGIECKNGNELTTIGSFFQSSCAAGTWSLDSRVNGVLKKENKNLCSLCEHPEICDEKDYFAGIYGQISCSEFKSGDVAFTTLESLMQNSRLNVSNYSFLCPNNTIAPLNLSNPCIWTKMPSTGYMVKNEREISARLSQLVTSVNDTVGKTAKPWMTDFFGSFLYLKKIDAARESWQNYLGNYKDVIDRTLSCEKKLRFCTKSEDETNKCDTFRMAAYGRHLRPEIECVQKNSARQCIGAIKNGDADIISLGSRDVYVAGKYYQMSPIVSEKFPEQENISYYAVAIIKADSNIRNLEDLKGKKSCHTSIGKNAGWIIPISELMKLNLLDKDQCDVVGQVGGFFSESCVPGAKDKEYNPTLSATDKLCKLCRDPEKCSTNDDFSGYEGAFRCLVQGGGDVAFVKHTTALDLIHNRGASWAKDLKAANYKLLCHNGTEDNISKYLDCNLGSVPPSSRFVVTSNKMEYYDRVNVVYMLTSAGKLFNASSPIFPLLGSYNGKSDLLFNNSTVSLESVDFNSKYDQVIREDYLEALTLADTLKCMPPADNSASTAVRAFTIIISSVLLSLFI